MKNLFLISFLLILISGCTTTDANKNLKYETLIVSYKNNLLDKMIPDSAITHFHNANTILKSLESAPEKEKKAIILSAISEYEASIALDPTFAPAHLGLGTAYILNKDEEKASLQFEEALRLNPTYYDALIAMAVLEDKNHLIDQCIQHLSIAAETNPKDVRALLLLGDSYIQIKDFNKARELFEKVIKLSPKNLQAQVALKSIEGKASETDLEEESRELEVIDKEIDNSIGVTQE